MRLSNFERDLFFELYYSLLLYANQQRRIIPDIFTLDGLRKAPPEQLRRVRRVLFEQLYLLDQYVVINPFNYDDLNLEIIYNWKRSVAGRFFVLNTSSWPTIFISNNKPPKLYGVVALEKDFDRLFSRPFPVYIETVLLPFKNKIVFDGIFSRFRLEFGEGFVRNLHNSYDEALKNEGIITTL